MDVPTSWGPVLKAKRGDMIVSRDKNDRWVVRKDIFHNSYHQVDGKWRKRPDLRHPFRIAGRAHTIQTLEGPVKVPRGHYVMTGTAKERWATPPDKFHAKYDVERPQDAWLEKNGGKLRKWVEARLKDPEIIKRYPDEKRRRSIFYGRARKLFNASTSPKASK